MAQLGRIEQIRQQGVRCIPVSVGNECKPSGEDIEGVLEVLRWLVKIRYSL